MANSIVAFAGAAWLAGALCLPAWACDLSPPETGKVANVLDGETLELTDGRTVRLIGAKAPAPPLGWRGDDPWPLVEEAKEALARLASGREVELNFGGRRLDRHGYVLARVYSIADNRACVAELLVREREARAKRLGLWSSSAYRIESALDLKRLGRLTPSYQLVEGRVAAVGQGGGRLYLNFTPDWRSDFTISVERKDIGAFAAAGIDLKTLAGVRVRVRGFLAWRNGPMIEASHPEQLELLPEGSPEEGAKPPTQPREPAIAL